jgi:uncharacterized protein (TIGR04255 family)
LDGDHRRQLGVFPGGRSAGSLIFSPSTPINPRPSLVLPVKRLLAPLVDHRDNFGRKAPIVEAIFSFRATLPDQISVEDLRAFDDPWPSRFSKAKAEMWWGDSDDPEPPTHAVRGLLFEQPTSERQGRAVARVRRDGFTFSLLHPYDSYEVFKAEAMPLWARYREVAQPIEIERLSLRYINRILLPREDPSKDVYELSDWIRFYPEFPDQLGPAADYMMRVVHQHPNNGRYVSVVTFSPDRDFAAPGRLPIIFDIEAYFQTESSPPDEELWAIFDDLRQFKNDVFFAAMTDQMWGVLK